MSDYDNYDGEFSNGADGACVSCGDDTEEPWHLYCSSCFFGDDDDEDEEDETDRCDACDRTLVEVRGKCICPNPFCTARGAA